MKKTLKRSLVMILATVLLIGTFAVTADAAAKKTVKKLSYNAEMSTIKKKATAVKKGTTNLTYTKGQGFIKFTAPSKKTYSFTFSNLKAKGETSAYVVFQVKDKDYPKFLIDAVVSTKGGKTDALWLASTGSPESKKGKVVDRFLHKRTGKIKLKKGETVYIYFESAVNKKNTMKLVIK